MRNKIDSLIYGSIWASCTYFMCLKYKILVIILFLQMVTSGGGGYLAYRRGAWRDVQAHSHHIKHLACEIV